MGRFIVFEGIDGSGKSTALQAVAAAMPDAWVTREETDTTYGEAVRQAIQARAPALTTAFLFLADRAQHVPQIKAHLEKGDVLCDRFAHSTLAYQSVALGMDQPLEFLRDLHRPLDLWPDHVLLFDLPADVAVGRAESRGATTPYEKVAFLEEVRTAYLGLAQAEPQRFTIIDATQSPEQVAADCLAALAEL
ncbi:MAG: dTMP kinase [Thermoplasmatota archaeon]